MPEGDTILRAARGLARVLLNKEVRRFESPLAPLARARLEGRTITAVEAHGKNLLMRFDDGRVLHSHMKMNGSWHLYRPGEKWKRPLWQMRALLEVDGAVAVCFHAPVVELLRSSDEVTAPLGPDVLAEAFDIDEAVRRLRVDRAIGDVILDQTAVAGLGNIYKSEVLFLRKIDPRRLASSLAEEELREMLVVARRLMLKNATSGRMRTTTKSPAARFHVYMRGGQPCFICGAKIGVIRQGPLHRTTYHCPRCQS